MERSGKERRALPRCFMAEEWNDEMTAEYRREPHARESKRPGRPPPPKGPVQRAAARPDSTHSAERGSLIVFESLFPKPASASVRQLVPPPPPAAVWPLISAVSKVPRPAPVPAF